MTNAAPDPRKVTEAALDVLVYAPVGLALEARELLPRLAERGRNHLVLARFAARVAKQRAQSAAPTGASPDGGATRAPANDAPVDPSSDQAPWPDYDAMTAVQIIALLDTLDVAGLEAARRYEESHRARRTVLNRIAQRTR
jgi:hypothetical protein